MKKKIQIPQYYTIDSVWTSTVTFAVVIKIYIAYGPSGTEIQNLTIILILTVYVKIIIAERKIHF